MAAGPLVDRDRRLQALDQIDVGPFELMEELPGVGREAFDVLPLPFGVERVEGQRALARPAGTGDHDEPVAGDVEIEVLQVVHPRPADADALVRRFADRGFPVHARYNRRRRTRWKPLIIRVRGPFRNCCARRGEGTCFLTAVVV